ncbi:MAG: hypothetical protein EA401_12430 [Planctomycetota bacterium]|nr:MAG: hypothetical protein EA401_12430 [Planctomycetota bacterium]
MSQPESLPQRQRSARWGSWDIPLCDQQQAALTGRQIWVEHLNSNFLCGTCVGKTLLADNAHGERQRSAVRAWFPLLVCENAMKWYATEAQQDVLDFTPADRLLDWAEAEGRRMRGHCLFWDKGKFCCDWVHDLDPASLRTRISLHLERILSRYRGRVRDWDVLNEILDGGFMAARLGEDGPAWIFRKAAALDPNLRLFTNEYGILDSDEKTERYYALIQQLLDAGAPVGGIGIQEHAAERFVPDAQQAALEADRPERQGRGPLIPDEIWRRLDRLASTGLPIHITEISIASEDKQRAGNCMELLLDTMYAHPAVECVLFWGFEGRSHWLGELAALIDPQGRPYPAMAKLSDWQRQRITPAHSLVSNDHGIIRLEGWCGRYRIRDEASGAEACITLEQHDQLRTATTLPSTP